jgi:hypothetical protein
MALTNVPQNKSEGTMRKFLMLTMMLAAPAMAQVPAGGWARPARLVRARRRKNTAVRAR